MGENRCDAQVPMIEVKLVMHAVSGTTTSGLRRHFDADFAGWHSGNALGEHARQKDTGPGTNCFEGEAEGQTIGGAPDTYPQNNVFAPYCV